MKRLPKLLLVAVLALVPSFSAVAQSTPEAVTDEVTPFAFGVGVPATYVDERGNPVFSITVTGIERDWQEYDEFSAPPRGMEFVLVSLSITNLTSRAAEVSPWSIYMVDSMGMTMDLGWIYGDSDLWQDLVPVGPGETVEGQIAYFMYADLEPMILMWQPDYSGYVFVYLMEPPAP